MLYEVLLHEIGHLQVILPKAKDPNRKFASESKAREFASFWRKELWSERYEHPDPVHNPPSREELHSLRTGWTRAHLCYKKGGKLEEAGQRRKAVESYRKAVDSYPNHSLALEKLGVLAYGGHAGDWETENWEYIATLFRDALAIDPMLYDATLYLGMTLHRLDDRDGARKMFERAISIEPYKDLAKTVYAEHLGYWGEYNKSEALFKRILKKDPTSGLALRDYAHMLMYKDEEVDTEITKRAIDLLEKAIDRGFPHYCHYLLGIAYSWLNKNEKAVWHLKEVARLKPGYKDTKELLIELELGSGQI